MSVPDQILGILAQGHIPFQRLEHPAVASCEDSAGYRAAADWSGVGSKCILFHAKGRFFLVVTAAGEDIKARLFKKPFGTKDIRFATAEELRQHTGCEPGSVPPFGHTSPDVPYFIDARLAEAEHFMFNPADSVVSLRIAGAALKTIYAAVPNPVTWFRRGAEGVLEFLPREALAADASAANAGGRENKGARSW